MRIIAAGARRTDDARMTTTEPQPPLAQQASPKHRNLWIWISALLAVVAVGLGIWAYKAQSDLDSSHDENAQLQAQVDQGKETGSTLVATAKGAYQDLTDQLGATNEDLAATQKDLEDAQAGAEKAAEDAASAVAGSAEEANAKAQEAESKARVAADCAKSYASAFGTLFEGDNIRDQASVVKDQIQSVSEACKAALSGS